VKRPSGNGGVCAGVTGDPPDDGGVLGVRTKEEI
jgi:hypothetical protein